MIQVAYFFGKKIGTSVTENYNSGQFSLIMSCDDASTYIYNLGKL